jgi:ADP-ribosyl-[dinitrogen reductase] hydrolase
MANITDVLDIKMNLAYGSFLGLLCGDAAGATLEFSREPITEALAERAMNMPGGGQLQVGPGQVTDDSELAISLAIALYKSNPRDGLPIDEIASQYSQWYESRPFDMGNTCGRAFGIRPTETNFATKMMHQATVASLISEANGSLMRIAPLAIWCASEKDDVIALNAKMEALLSHPNVICQDCNAVYCIAIAYLINHPHDYQGAISHLQDYVNYHVFSKVKDWFNVDSLDITDMICTNNIGHVRWAFTLAIYFLRNNTPYEEAIKSTLMKGGDTDTNCAIVGGLLGALHGIENIPCYMKDPVLAFDGKNPGSVNKRPSRFNASNVMPLTYYLLTHKHT